LVCFSVSERGGERIARSVNLPGGRADVRDRSTVVAMHLVRRLLMEAASVGSTGGQSARSGGSRA
jgi:nicotinamide-nucleotide amidase